MTDTELAAIKARADAATPPPWTVIESAETPNGPEYGIEELMGTADDYAFIAAARSDVPALRGEVERLRAAMAAEREACAAIADARNVVVDYGDPSYHSECGASEAAEEIAAAIRARGKP